MKIEFGMLGRDIFEKVLARQEDRCRHGSIIDRDYTEMTEVVCEDCGMVFETFVYGDKEKYK